MWDPENKSILVEDFSNIKECLNSGIIYEKEAGKLISTFNMIEPYIQKETTLEGIIKKIERLIKNSNLCFGGREKVGYFNVDEDSLVDLKEAIIDLDKIIGWFFEDFDKGEENFSRFYKRIKKFISSRIENSESIDNEMHIVISKLLKRFEEIDLPDTGTFNCLKQTMSYYLSQEDDVNKGAKWIVKNFEQIDGDVLRSALQENDNVVYHFCCLSDKDVCSNKDERLPWPLDINFFESGHKALDMKYQIFLKSKMEYKNFKRYALLYGLEFNRVPFKLSYVLNEDNNENDLLYILKLLGVKTKKYSSFNTSNYLDCINEESDLEKIKEITNSLSKEDKIKFKMCPYRFALESIGQGKTIFTDSFLIHSYIKIILTNKVLYYLSMKQYRYDDEELKEIIEEEYGNIKCSFMISDEDELEKTQIISAVYKKISNNVNQNTKKSKKFDFKLKKTEETFLYTDIKKIEEELKKEDINDKIEKSLKDKNFYCRYGNYCMYCSSKNICLEYVLYGGGNQV